MSWSVTIFAQSAVAHCGPRKSWPLRAAAYDKAAAVADDTDKRVWAGNSEKCQSGNWYLEWGAFRIHFPPRSCQLHVFESTCLAVEGKAGQDDGMERFEQCDTAWPSYRKKQETDEPRKPPEKNPALYPSRRHSQAQKVCNRAVPWTMCGGFLRVEGLGTRQNLTVTF